MLRLSAIPQRLIRKNSRRSSRARVWPPSKSAWPTTGGPEILQEEIRKDYEKIVEHHRLGHERDFTRSFQDLLKKAWFEDITKFVTKRGLLSFGRKARYFARGGIKEMGTSNNPALGWPQFEAIPKFSNSLSEMFSGGKRLEHFSMDERDKIRKYISKVSVFIY